VLYTHVSLVVWLFYHGLRLFVVRLWFVWVAVAPFTRFPAVPHAGRLFGRFTGLVAPHVCSARTVLTRSPAAVGLFLVVSFTCYILLVTVVQVWFPVSTFGYVLRLVCSFGLRLFFGLLRLRWFRYVPFAVRLFVTTVCVLRCTTLFIWFCGWLGLHHVYVCILRWLTFYHFVWLFVVRLCLPRLRFSLVPFTLVTLLPCTFGLLFVAFGSLIVVILFVC